MISSYKELFVWQRSIQLAKAVYELTKHFPASEQFGLTAQMRRSSVSIASNIAEGRNRGTKKDFLCFLYIAYGSCSELETQILVAKNVLKIDISQCQKVDSLLEETMKMLNTMIQKLKS